MVQRVKRERKMTHKVVALTTLLLFLSICMPLSVSAQIDGESLREITTAVRDMCLHPDRRGNFLRVEGEADAGVILRFVGTQIAGTIQYENWEGINQRVDEYQMDPRECAVQVLTILIANFQIYRPLPPGDIQNLLQTIIQEFLTDQVNRSRFTNQLILEINRQKPAIFPMLQTAGILEEVRFKESQENEDGKRLYRFIAYHEESSFLWTISTNIRGIVDALYVQPL